MPTYVRNDNSDSLYQVDSVHTETNEKRINGLLGRNSEGLGQNSWLGVGYIPGDINTSDGPTEILSSAELRNILARNISA